jgi:ElaB/YqjD/DUF883 family membrane-anchored ribosome-binding protein
MHKLFFQSWLTAFCFFLSIHSFSQGKLIEMKDSAGLNSFSVLNGDTVLIRFDSAYVMNKATFKIYERAYLRAKNGDPTTKKLLDDYKSLIDLQDSMLQRKEEYYQALKSNFDSLVHGSNVFLDRTSTNIVAINQSLTNATNEINNIKFLLDDSLKKLKVESRQKFIAAVKGFGVGVGVAALVFLITK